MLVCSCWYTKRTCEENQLNMRPNPAICIPQDLEITTIYVRFFFGGGILLNSHVVYVVVRQMIG